MTPKRLAASSAGPGSGLPPLGALGVRRLTRREFLRFGAAGAGAVVLAACGADTTTGGGATAPGTEPVDGTPPPAGSLVFLSTQLRPVEEAEKVRNVILAGFDRQVEFVPEDEGPWIDRLVAGAEAGSGQVDLVGGQHGDFASIADRDVLMDLSDLAQELSDRAFPDSFLELGRFGGDQQLYIPWMQATYVMAASSEAVEHLPDGADLNALTYDELLAWAQNLADAGAPPFGIPAGEDGLLHRFFQGYGYPSFTGALNTAFTSAGAVAMWEWLRAAWEVANPQSTTYGFMQEPLLSGEVGVAWDHTARLVGALNERPGDFVAFPAPIGPEGLGFMPVVAGLGIPANAPDPEGAMELIRYLTSPEVAATTVREVAFFPAGGAELPADLPEGVQALAEAIRAQQESPHALPSLLPVGLGDQGGAYNKVFQDSFRSIILQGGDIAETLQREASNLQAVLDTAAAACWEPDPPSDGVCQVG